MSKTLRQSATLAIRDGLICMVTSRNGRRWVIPKGHVDPGHTAQDAARIEAWEEAGLIGIVDTDPIGTYHYEKYETTRQVDVYMMAVIDKEGKTIPRGHEDELKTMGSDIKLSSTPEAIRVMLTDVVMAVLNKVPKDEIDKIIMVFRREMQAGASLDLD